MHYDLVYFKLFLLLLQCQSLIEELSASNSTDLQQRAYELQATIGLDAEAVGNIMPADASCEDIEVTFFSARLFIYFPLLVIKEMSIHVILEDVKLVCICLFLFVSSAQFLNDILRPTSRFNVHLLFFST